MSKGSNRRREDTKRVTENLGKVDFSYIRDKREKERKGDDDGRASGKPSGNNRVR